jgi:hypothetical protein
VTLARASGEVGGRRPPTTPSNPGRPKAAPPSAEAGGRRPPATPSFDRFAVERPKRGLTNERGPSLETPAPLKPAVTLATGPRSPARQPALAPGLSNARGGFCRVQLMHHPSRTRLSWGTCTRRISGSPHPCGTTRGRGPGPAVVPGRGPTRRWSGLERAGFETGEKCGSRLRRSIASVEGMGCTRDDGDGGAVCPRLTPDDDGDGGASVPDLSLHVAADRRSRPPIDDPRERRGVDHRSLREKVPLLLIALVLAISSGPVGRDGHRDGVLPFVGSSRRRSFRSSECERSASSRPSIEGSANSPTRPSRTWSVRRGCGAASPMQRRSGG